ncbi:SH3 domain-containing protein [Peribacillus asahii]|uniref:SH3 domain-containing protein n=1 Tax=Peribacillus asahii TaxID=228899 RepID=UPI00207A1214|nr:SH3 domain-containing protein [Peribacillus asahii]USK69184.1 SH3 domain-containing protein [Peribacillus asahii]
MKKLIKIFITFILLLSFFSLNSLKAEAAKPKIAHVNIKSGTLNVRSGASEKAKKVGSLKKDAGVYVYSKTKSGWSEIRYKKKKAYVATKYLRFANSYVMDKTKVYTYMEHGNKYKDVYTGKGYQGWDEWITNESDIYIVREDKNGLYLGVPEGGYNTEIKYPIKVGKSWRNDGGSTVRISSVSKTIKTPAGTFKNCIEVTYDYGDGDGSKFYYAKNVGFVKSVYKGIAINQLIRLENKK